MLPRILFCICLLAAAFFASAAEDDPAELVQARATYEKEFEFAVRPLRDRYVSRLDALKRSLGSRGDARGAFAVQEEIDRVRSSQSGEGDISRFAGTWKITYKTGVTGTFIIRPNGTVQWTEEAGRAVKRKGKITVRNSVPILDFEEDGDRLWKLALTGQTLVLDFYQPKATYPAGTPFDRGTGVNQFATKP